MLAWPARTAGPRCSCPHRPPMRNSGRKQSGDHRKGVPRDLPGAGGTALTASTMVVGIPAYMSPEQAQGPPVGLASEAFALGGVLSFAATGTAPFGRGEPIALAYRVVHADLDLAVVPPALRYLMAACLAKAPNGRPSLAGLLH